MDFVTADLLNDIGVLTVLVAIALAVITDKLVWHTRLKRAEARAEREEARAERWERLALDALTASAQASVAAAEITADVVRALPDPAQGGVNGQ